MAIDKGEPVYQTMLCLGGPLHGTAHRAQENVTRIAMTGPGIIGGDDPRVIDASDMSFYEQRRVGKFLVWLHEELASAPDILRLERLIDAFVIHTKMPRY